MSERNINELFLGKNEAEAVQKMKEERYESQPGDEPIMRPPAKDILIDATNGFKGLWIALAAITNFYGSETGQNHISKGLQALDARLNYLLGMAQKQEVHPDDAFILRYQAAKIIQKMNSLHNLPDGANRMGFKVVVIEPQQT